MLGCVPASALGKPQSLIFLVDLANVRSSDQAAGRSTQRAKVSRATARLTATGRTREQAVTETVRVILGIHVSEAPSPHGQAKRDFAGSAPAGSFNAKGNPSGNCGGNPSATVYVSETRSPQCRLASRIAAPLE
jgi:hypothetical protein